MPFCCPDCLSTDGLEIDAAIQLPPDSRSDEIFIQLGRCRQCGFQGAAVYEESRRGALDQDDWSHTGYCLELEVCRRWEGLIRSCPDPFNWRCRCQAHLAFNAVDAWGRWQLPPELARCATFPMQMQAD